MPRKMLAVLAVAVSLGAALPAQARFHFWQVNEVFTNADGSIQFVEFHTNLDFQDLLGAHELQIRVAGTTIASAPFGADLESFETADQFLLMATPGFVDVAGVDPNFEMPVGTIPIDRLDEIDQAGIDGAASTNFSFAAGSIPSDGSMSLNRGVGAAAATPTNFAGVTGTIVPEPAAGSLAAFAALLGVVRVRRASRSR